MFRKTPLKKVEEIWTNRTFRPHNFLGTWGLYYKTFYGRNLRNIVISLSSLV
jgi:hypothetical protein